MAKPFEFKRPKGFQSCRGMRFAMSDDDVLSFTKRGSQDELIHKGFYKGWERARRHIEHRAVIKNYKGDLKAMSGLLNEVLATKWSAPCATGELLQRVQELKCRTLKANFFSMVSSSNVFNRRETPARKFDRLNWGVSAISFTRLAHRRTA